MGSTPHFFLLFVIFFVVSLTLQTVAGQNIPADAELLEHDRSFLIPGIGRAIVPKKGSYVDPFHYNPITGSPSGTGDSIPGVDGSGGGASGRNYVPGSDDTYLPNPGAEVPSPVGGQGVSPPSGH